MAYYLTPWFSIYLLITSIVALPVVIRQYDGLQKYSFHRYFLIVGYSFFINLDDIDLYEFRNFEILVLGLALNKQWTWSKSLPHSVIVMPYDLPAYSNISFNLFDTSL